MLLLIAPWHRWDVLSPLSGRVVRDIDVAPALIGVFALFVILALAFFRVERK